MRPKTRCGRATYYLAVPPTIQNSSTGADFEAFSSGEALQCLCFVFNNGRTKSCVAQPEDAASQIVSATITQMGSGLHTNGVTHTNGVRSRFKASRSISYHAPHSCVVKSKVFSNLLIRDAPVPCAWRIAALRVAAERTGHDAGQSSMKDATELDLTPLSLTPLSSGVAALARSNLIR